MPGSTIRTATKLQALLAAGLLSCMGAAGGDAAGFPGPTQLWAAPDRGLVLLRRDGDGGFRVCPEVKDMNHQPFCRRFSTPVLAACGNAEELQLVLANGEIHRVNRALIGVDGSFEPSHRPDQAMELARVWMPEQSCFPGDGFNHVLAVTASGNLWHFDGKSWRRISGHRVGLLGASSPSTLIKVLSWIVTAYMAFNLLGNLTSPSLAETLVFGPITLLLLISCALVSLSKW